MRPAVPGVAKLVRSGGVRPEVVASGELLAERLLDVGHLDSGCLIADRSGRSWVPVETERAVDVLEHGADGQSRLDDDNRREKPGTANHSLCRPDQLRLPPGVDGECARAVLAGYLANSRVDSQSPERVGLTPSDCGEAVLDAGQRCVVGDDFVDHDAPLVIGGGATTWSADHWGEAMALGRPAGLVEPGRKGVPTAEGNRWTGTVDPNGGPTPAVCDGVEQNG